MNAPRARRTRGARAASLAGLVRRGRELPALGLVLVWLFGVVVAPIVHLALHASLGAHSHASVASDDARGEGLCHDDHCHEASSQSDAVDGGEHDDEAPADHGRGSALHGDVAALFPAPALVVPPFVAFGERTRPEVREDVVDALPAPPSLARGPPLG
jgi:hypothetical protein